MGNKDNKSGVPAPAQPTQTMAIASVPQSMTALQICENAQNIASLGALFAQSNFFGLREPSAATAAIVNCFFEGLSPMQYRAKYHVMEDGTTAIKSDFLQRNFRRLGGKWKFKEWTNEVCEVAFTFEGDTTIGRVTLQEFKDNGIAIAKNGGLKKNWAKFPQEMLKARCMAKYIRAICPEAAEGLYTQEEMEENVQYTVSSAPYEETPAAPPSQVVTPPPAVPPQQVVAQLQPIDVEHCPPCQNAAWSGQRWDNESVFDIATLELALSAPFPDEMKAYIKTILDKRRGRAAPITSSETVPPMPE